MQKIMKYTDLFFINKLIKPLFVGDLNSGSNSFLKPGFSLRNFMFKGFTHKEYETFPNDEIYSFRSFMSNHEN